MRSENNKGFTLVEIAIVLVIIGLLMGGVLKEKKDTQVSLLFLSSFSILLLT
ncbi:type II secretion system protein [Hydrogenovibrio halophilus]|uniref:type II secretion system protein n=1 Tax=Hydrogenovibrio halophilus TaxID=373391 RepID=UPI0003692C69|nr:prepilin-type N-terminal cleavage/methylation domain-containing protein [Hydrogenovibrio halophilus]